jgi:diacylglycerol kinase family enzyme
VVPDRLESPRDAAFCGLAALEVAILPGGTLNHVARDFGLPLDNPAATLDIAATEIPTFVALCYVNGHAMLNPSAVGI